MRRRRCLLSAQRILRGRDERARAIGALVRGNDVSRQLSRWRHTFVARLPTIGQASRRRVPSSQVVTALTERARTPHLGNTTQSASRTVAFGCTAHLGCATHCRARHIQAASRRCCTHRTAWIVSRSGYEGRGEWSAQRLYGLSTILVYNFDKPAPRAASDHRVHRPRCGYSRTGTSVLTGTGPAAGEPDPVHRRNFLGITLRNVEPSKRAVRLISGPIRGCRPLML